MKKSKRKYVRDEVKTEVKPSFTHQQLQDALFHVQDAFERAMCQFFVLGDTARHIVRDEEKFDGDEDVHIGVRKASLTKEALATLKDWIPNLEVSEVQLSYFYNGVPVVIDVIHGDYEVFKNPDLKYYYISEFLVPNPWKQYWQQHEFIK